MPAKAKMTTGRGRVATDESYGPMSAYQRLIAQDEFWESWDGGVAENKAISEMPAPYAINALHKLARWQHHLNNNATQARYGEERAKMFLSPLASALIEQALGEFYTGTFLQQAPHVDDWLAKDAAAPVVDSEQLLEASITGAVELEKHADESIGARARILYRVLATTITTEAS